MKNCPKCNASVSDDAVFCNNCGSLIEPNDVQQDQNLQDSADYSTTPQEPDGYQVPPQNNNGYQVPPQNNNGYQVPPQNNSGYQVPPQNPYGYQTPPQQGYAYQNQQRMPYNNSYYAVNPYDHTSEFDAKDISDNKVIAMLPYLLGIMGILIAMLAKTSSPFVDFHVHQALKFTVLDALLGMASVVLCWTVIVPILGGICLIVMLVVKIICFVQICSNKAIEPAIIRNLGFLK